VKIKFLIVKPLRRREGAISVACVHPSVRRVQANNREPKSLVGPNLEERFPTLDATRIPVSRSNGQRSGSPGPLMLTHIVSHIFRMARLTNFKLGTWMEDDDPHQPQAPWPLRSKVKVISSHRLYVSSLSLLDSGNKMLYLWQRRAGAYRVGRTRWPLFLFYTFWKINT